MDRPREVDERREEMRQEADDELVDLLALEDEILDAEAGAEDYRIDRWAELVTGRSLSRRGWRNA